MNLFLNENWLYETYLIEELSVNDIAKMLNIRNPSLITYYLKKFNIPIRNAQQARKTKNYKEKMCGRNNPMHGVHLNHERNPRWKGGLKSYYANIARKVWEDYWNQKLPDGYCIHHVDRNKRNNNISNLVSMPFGSHTTLHNLKRSKGERAIVEPAKEEK